jgi:uncharacterized protein YggU (UPF0235/DUF167 family)
MGRLWPLARIVVTVSAGASRTRLLGRHGDGWKASVTAAPERGRANEALIDLLAKKLRVGRGRLAVVAGKTTRRKIVEVEGLEFDEISRRLDG